MKNKRQDEIVKQLMSKKFLKTDELLLHFGVSIETIRRDIRDLVNLGIAKKVYGGIQVMSSHFMVSGLDPWHIRYNRNHEEKQLITSRALDLIPDGTTIALDTGTTVHMLAEQLYLKRNLKIITNSVHMVSELVRGSNNEIFLIGGQLHKEEQVTMGTFISDFLEHFALIELFLCGADGFSLDCGITECSEVVADVKRQLLAKSEKTVLLSDHSKFGKKALFKSCPVECIDTLITDSNTSDDYLEAIREAGIEVIVV